MVPDDAQEKMEAFLGKLRQRLRGMSDEDVREILEELRSHITDKAAAGGALTPGGVDAALSVLGSPEELASQYLTYGLLARAEVSRSPLHLLDCLFRWGSLSFAGFCVLLASLVGYVLGIACILCAFLKPFHPHTAGLWTYPDSGNGIAVSLRLGFGTPPSGGKDLLGWWIVPIGLTVGSGLVMLTTRFALWCGRQYRRSHKLLQG